MFWKGERKLIPRFFSLSQGEQVSNSISARTYKECSALQNDGVDEIFEAATRAAMLVRSGGENSNGGGGGGGEKRRRKEDEGEGKGCGCVIL